MRIELYGVTHHYFVRRRRRTRLVLTLETHECFKPGAPCDWKAPNGVVVWGDVSGWNTSFHDAHYYDDARYMASAHRHIGPARRALRAYWENFGSTKLLESIKLRSLVRKGD